MNRRTFVSLVSVITISSISLNVFTSCNKKSQARELTYVEESEWFDSKCYETKLYEGYNGSSGLLDGPVIYADSDEVIVYEWFSKGNNQEDYVLCDYALRDDGTCELMGSVDLYQSGVYIDDRDSDYQVPIYYYYLDDMVYCILEHWVEDDVNYGTEYYIQKIDVKNSCLGEEIHNENIESVFSNGWPIRIWCSDSKFYMLMSTSNELFVSEYRLMVFDSEFELLSDTLVEGLDSNDWISSSNLVDNDTLVLIENQVNDNSSVCYLLDINECVAVPIDNPPAEIYSVTWSNSNNHMMYSDAYGVYEYDYESNSINEIFSFNNTNVNRYESNQLVLCYADDNSLLTYFTNWNDGCSYKFWKFTRADENPNVGEAILRVADIDGMINSRVAEAIYQFNESSTTSYIEFDNRYLIDDYLIVDDSRRNVWEYQQTDEYKVAERDAASALSNQLRVDIFAGDGPDIILDAFNHNEYNNHECFVDLKPYLLEDSEINQDEYLPVVFASNEIYQMPLDVSVVGISWKSQAFDSIGDTYGISYDTYLSVVDEYCNGDDPISVMYSQNEYFLELFNYNYNDFIVNGEINLDNEEFRSLVEFVSSRMPHYTYDMYNYSMYPDASYNGEFDLWSLNHYVGTGLPSIDGETGLKFQCSNSIAVTITCPMMDDALSLVKSSINEFSDKLTIEGVRRYVENSFDNMNSIILNDDTGYYTEYNLYDGEEADIYMDMVMSSDELISSDADIDVILYEEIQPYFAGDKTLDEVIPIIEDRVQTVLDERG